MLAPDAATTVGDLILSPPADTSYATLKKELIKRTAGSHQQKLQKLLSCVELGDQKPSQLLRRMRQLWSGDANDILFRELFLQRLPANVRMVLASADPSISLDALAETADHIMEVSGPSVTAVRTPHATSELDSLRSEVRQLQDLMRNLSTAGHPAIALPPPLAIAHPAPFVVCTPVETQPCVGITKIFGMLPPRGNNQASR